MSNDTNSNALDMLDTLLDKEIDDLADLPEFKVPATGIYKLTVAVAPKVINEKPAVEATFTIVELVELADSETPVEEIGKNGDKFSTAFFLKDKEGNDSEMGFGRLKQFVKPFQEHYNEGNLRTLITEHLKGETTITAKVVKQERKSEKGKFDARVSDVTID